MTKEKLLIIYGTYLAIMTAITFFAYGIDKLKAKANGWRIPEKALLTLSLLGGAIGGILGMKIFRHKTKHWYFTALNIIGIIVHAALLILILFVFQF